MTPPGNTAEPRKAPRKAKRPASEAAFPPLFPRGVVVDASASHSEQLPPHAMLWSIEQDQLEPGPYRGRIMGFHLDHIQLGFSDRSAATLAHGRCPAGAVVLCALLTPPRRCFFRMAPVGRRELFVVWPEEEFTFQAMGASRIVTVAVAREFLSDWIQRQGGLPLETRCVDGRLTVAEDTSVDAIGRQLLLLIQNVVRGPERLRDPAQCARLEDEILQAILGPIESAAREFQQSPRREIALQAKAFLDENRHQPLRLRDLTARTGRSARSLEAIFREAFGMSLRARLQTVRLNGARRDLLAAAGTGAMVKEIALTWGFRHMGRFSVTYHRWFGETPQETLRGKPARAAER